MFNGPGLSFARLPCWLYVGVTAFAGGAIRIEGVAARVCACADCNSRTCVLDSGRPSFFSIAACRVANDGAGGGGVVLATTSRVWISAGGG